MDRARDPSLQEEFVHALLELTDERHSPIQFEGTLSVSVANLKGGV
jgi:hypothetical protein